MSNNTERIYKPEELYTPTCNVRFIPVFKPKQTQDGPKPAMPATLKEREDRIWDFLFKDKGLNKQHIRV